MADQKIDVKLDTGGLTLFLLFITFLVLKLTAVIDWSWWWITAPVWGVPALILGVGALALIGIGISSLFKRSRK